MVVIAWIIFSIIVGVAASNKGRSGWGFFFLSLILSPLIGGLAILAAARNESRLEAKKLQSGDSRKCPFCAELIKKEATKCRHCGADIT